MIPPSTSHRRQLKAILICRWRLISCSSILAFGRSSEIDNKYLRGIAVKRQQSYFSDLSFIRVAPVFSSPHFLQYKIMASDACKISKTTIKVEKLMSFIFAFLQVLACTRLVYMFALYVLPPTKECWENFKP